MFQLKTVEFVRVIFVLFDWRRDISQYIIIVDSIGHSILWTAASLNASDNFLLQFSQARREGHSGIDEPSLSTVHATLIWIEQPTDRNTHTRIYWIMAFVSTCQVSGSMVAMGIAQLCLSCRLYRNVWLSPFSCFPFVCVYLMCVCICYNGKQGYA